jgi:hypothetical protein
MHWEKLGLLWQPNGEPAWAATHAAIPVVQTAAHGLWWAYLSIRDAAGRSHIGRIAVDPGPRPKFRRFDPQPVLGLGPPGAFDDCGVMPSWIVDAGGQLRMYYIGWNVPTTVPYRLAIGIAVSDDDGATWRRNSAGPVFDRGPDEPFFVTTPCVLRDGDRWRMWYASCCGWRHIQGRWEPRYFVRHADSPDGVRWTPTPGASLDPGDQWAAARPCVWREGDAYRMLYSYRRLLDYRTEKHAAYRLGYAESNDGVAWQADDGRAGLAPSADGWDSEMIAYGYLHRDGGESYLFYNGNGFGRSGVGVARLAT